MLGSMLQNRSLDRSAIFGTGARRGINEYLSETGRNWSQPSLAINRLVGAATGRRLPQPPPEAQKPMAMPLPNTPLPMNQKPVALSFRNRYGLLLNFYSFYIVKKRRHTFVRNSFDSRISTQ